MFIRMHFLWRHFRPCEVTSGRVTSSHLTAGDFTSDIFNLKPGALYGKVFGFGCDVTSGHAKSGHMMTSLPFPVTQLPVASLPAKVLRLFVAWWGGCMTSGRMTSGHVTSGYRIFRNWHHVTRTDVIHLHHTPHQKTPLHYSHPCRNLNGGLMKPSLSLRHGRVITSHCLHRCNYSSMP